MIDHPVQISHERQPHQPLTSNSCQRWTGGAYTSNAIVPRSAFKVTKGLPTTHNLPHQNPSHPMTTN
jgi:hypothetical protein